MLINPGGPGASGVGYGRQARHLFDSGLLDRFDIVSFDPRGVGQSAPVQCEDGPALDRLFEVDFSPESAAEQQADVDAARAFDASCASHDKELLAHVSTRDAARDMDAIRAAVGDAKLTYLGKSYGTFLGAAYASLFPDHVRALVLDGAVDPSLPWDQWLRQQSQGFEQQLHAFYDNCTSRGSSCPLNKRGGAQAAVQRVLDASNRAPLPAPLVPGHRLLGHTLAILGITTGLYDSGDWSELALAVNQADRGDGSSLLLFADALNDRHPDGTYGNIVPANNAVNCTDQPWPRDVAAYQQLAAQSATESPFLGPENVWFSLFCAFWPVPATSAAGPLVVRNAPPILVVGTLHDPATPYPWAQSLTRQMGPAGRLLTYRGNGHTAYHRGSSCIDGAVDQYLLNLTVPQAGTSCG